VVLELHAWVWLAELRRRYGAELTLGTAPDGVLRGFAEAGYDGIWLMGVWERSPRARAIARGHRGVRAECRRVLPDLEDADIVGSPYAIHRYRVDPHLGGDRALEQLRVRLQEHGLRLILDFVPNHLALDHPWVREHPERFVQLDPAAGGADSQAGFTVRRGGRVLRIAHGRDPYFPPWSDTAQLDYRNQETRRAMIEELLAVAARCDGLRCDMAMLLIERVFRRTWGGEAPGEQREFWVEAIGRLRDVRPGFLMIAEAYWDLEWELLQMGFDHAYDKRLYDRLRDRRALPIIEHLRADYDFQRRLVRFVENHDEERARVAMGEFALGAAALCLTLPGLRLIHQGQIEGRRIRIPVQLGRRPEEPPEPESVRFYEALLRELRQPVFHEGEWRLLEGLERPRSPEPRLVVHRWRDQGNYRLVAVNTSDEPVRLALPLQDLPPGCSPEELRDLLAGSAGSWRPRIEDGEWIIEMAPFGRSLLGAPGSLE
jgi:hypothetical protein